MTSLTIISEDLLNNTIVTVTNNLIIQVDETLTIPNGKTLVISSTGSLNNNGTINNKGTINNEGTITNTKTINNYSGGLIDNKTGGVFHNSQGTVINGRQRQESEAYKYEGTINNSGELFNNHNSIINNYSGGIIHNNKDFYNHSTQEINAGEINNYFGGEINNNHRGFISNFNYAKINNNEKGIFNNNYWGIIVNSMGTISNKDEAIINNNGGIQNSGNASKIITISGALINNKGLINNINDGIISNSLNSNTNGIITNFTVFGGKWTGTSLPKYVVNDSSFPTAEFINMQMAAKILGYNETSWNSTTDTNTKKWVQLNNIERLAANFLGYIETSWNADNMNEVANKPHSYDLSWEELIREDIVFNTMQEAAIKMGYNKEIWDNAFFVYSKYWSDLTSQQKAAATELGYTKTSWDNLSGNEKLPESNQLSWVQLAGIDPNLKLQEAVITLGYNETSWNNINEPQPSSVNKSWHDTHTGNEEYLTNEEKNAAAKLGYNKTTWNNESGTEEQPLQYITLSWNQLAGFSNLQPAAKALGYNQESWDDITSIDTKLWSELTIIQKTAASFMGYTETSWNNISNIASQPVSDRLTWAQLTGARSTSTSATGDPYVTPVYGSRYKLPDKHGIYRYISNKTSCYEDRFSIDADVVMLTKKQQAETLRFAILHAKQHMLSTNNRVTLEGYFFRNYMLTNSGNKLLIDMEENTINKKPILIGNVIKTSEFTVTVGKKLAESCYPYTEDNLVDYSLTIKTFHETYGNIEINLYKYVNPQIRNGISMRTDNKITHENSKGFIMQYQDSKQFSISKLGSKKDIANFDKTKIPNLKKKKEEEFTYKNNVRKNHKFLQQQVKK